MNQNELLKQYQELVSINDHTGAALLLVENKYLGAAYDEREEIQQIAERHKKLGYITEDDYRRRNEISKKYCQAYIITYSKPDDRVFQEKIQAFDWAHAKDITKSKGGFITCIITN